jgi:hypothetical protein
MKRRGFTLSETMISVGLFSIFLIILCQMYTSTFQALRAYDQPLKERQMTYATLNHLGQVIRNTPALIQPTYMQLMLGGNATGMVAREGDRVCGYCVNGTALEQVFYQSDYDPTDNTTWTQTEPPHVLCNNVTLFQVSLYSPDQLTLVQLKIQTPVLQLQTLMNFREVQ